MTTDNIKRAKTEGAMGRNKGSFLIDNPYHKLNADMEAAWDEGWKSEHHRLFVIDRDMTFKDRLQRTRGRHL